MCSAFYSNDIKTFLNQNEDEIFGIIAKNDEFDSTSKQKDAWIAQIRLLKNVLNKYSNGSVIFEYTIPRVGGRIDNVVLLDDTIFVLEFKVGNEIYTGSAATQARTYAIDLANFHEESHNKTIVPILIATDAPECDLQINKYKNNVYDVIYTNGNNLTKIFDKFKKLFSTQIQLNKWLNSRYVPTPTIIEAAEILYNNHSVDDISQNEAAENLTKTSAAVQKIIEYSKQNHQKAICFITGVPGAGKTLAGLNIAIENQKTTGKNYSCFLTGNQPLVSVLREALARDDNKRTGIPIGEARDNVKSFIQIIHHFRDESLKNLDIPPVDNVVIFDEAQRAWQQVQLSNFMNEKKAAILNKLPDDKRHKILSMSEPELLIEYMNRHQDWAVIVCLVGGGQDINTGEAGIQEWFDSMRRSYPDWKVYVSNKITDEEYVGNNSFGTLIEGLNCKTVEELHLYISLRSFRSEKVANFVHHLLNNEKEQAAAIYEEIKKVYPICITRDLNTAKEWIKKQTDGKNCRYGLIASSQAKRLRAEGIWVECNCKPEKWFLEGKNDIKSSYFMEEVATEFDIQGLEIDYALVGWDADYRYENGHFECYKPSGSKWQTINKEDNKRYLKNAYRVLLTRAREGFIIFVPKGDNSDNTRLCKYYDELWEYLKSVGIYTV
ncbi:MAG: DUF2075 domain-containing protein [Sphaerochaetaceae bacterium]|nr:DUF2075 domain-containing protein [Spirochaetales bacterium]MDY5967894.1 DUF2075 domain-containing protein [Sphaerochaetaceae bacterium]